MCICVNESMCCMCCMCCLCECDFSDICVVVPNAMYACMFVCMYVCVSVCVMYVRACLCV